MRTTLHGMRTNHVGRAVDRPLPASRSRSERRFDSRAMSCAKHRGRRRRTPLDEHLLMRQMRQMRQTRAARGDTPGRLSGSRTGIGQMPIQGPNMKVTRRPGRSLHGCPGHPHLPSLLRVVPSVALLVKGAASRAPEDDTPDGRPAGVDSARSAPVRPYPRRLDVDHVVCQGRGGAR